ncbi:PorV/PorQ family protein [bacterium]|nr:PorV/PorQ family protein [bacterium]
MNRGKHPARLTAIALFVYIIIPTVVFSAQPGGQAGAFLRLGLGAERIAMGDCGTALGGGGMNWYYNPAGLREQENRQAIFSYRFMSLNRSIKYAGFSTPLKPMGGFAIGVIRAGVDEIDLRDSNGNRLEMSSISENLIHGTFTLKPHPRIAVGISIKWLISDVPDILDDDKNLLGKGMSVDLGIRYEALENLRFGLQLRDLGAGYTWQASELWGDERSIKENDFPVLLRVGAAWDPLPDLTLVSDVIADPDRIGDDSEALEPHFGIEYRQQMFALRTGYNSRVLTFGFGLDLDLTYGKACLDYAFYIEDIAPDAAHMFSLAFEF